MLFASDNLARGFVLVISIVVCELGFSADIRNGHCFAGCPKSPAQGSEYDNALIIRPIYTLSYNSSTKVADWAAYTVTVDSIGVASNLSRVPIPDNYLSSTLAADDFSQEIDAPFVLGRLVPLLNFSGTPFWQDINYSSNGIPISRSLNAGAWNGLDWSIRNLVNRVGKVFVLAGPIYFTPPQVASLETVVQHQVPDAYFKLVISEAGASSVFILNQNLPVHTHHCNLTSTLDEVQRMTGLNLLPGLNKLPLSSLDAALGCG
jgi:endonuclease G